MGYHKEEPRGQEELTLRMGVAGEKQPRWKACADIYIMLDEK